MEVEEMRHWINGAKKNNDGLGKMGRGPLWF
jgi:hypothetical protein